MASRNQLRESTEALMEFMYGSSSYPGPEPGKLWSLSNSYPGHPAAKMWQDLALNNMAKPKTKKKKADIRPHLRKLALWLQQRDKP